MYIIFFPGVFIVAALGYHLVVVCFCGVFFILPFLVSHTKVYCLSQHE